MQCKSVFIELLCVFVFMNIPASASAKFNVSLR